MKSMKTSLVGGVIGLGAVLFVALWYSSFVAQTPPALAPVVPSVNESQTGTVAHENPTPQLPKKSLITVTPSDPVEMRTAPEATIYKMGEGTVLHWTIRAPETFTAGTMSIRQWALQVVNGSIIWGGFIFETSSLQTIDPAASWLLTQLLGQDVLDAATYPTASFILQEADGGMIRGVLTLKWMSKSLSIPAVVIVEDDGIVLTADVAVSRTQRAGVPVQDTLGEYVEIAFTIPFAP